MKKLGFHKKKFRELHWLRLSEKVDTFILYVVQVKNVSGVREAVEICIISPLCNNQHQYFQLFLFLRHFRQCFLSFIALADWSVIYYIHFCLH